MNILMASAEMAPLAKTGGLGDVVGALPKALARRGHTLTLVMPFYRFIHADRYGIARDGDWFDAWVGGEHVFGGLHRWDPYPGVRVYLVAQDHFFGREGIYGDRYGGFGDNHRRFIFLSHAVLETARRMAAHGHPPDVYHGHDWHVGLVPVYLREGRAGWPLPSVFTIHNLRYQGRFGKDVLYQAGLSDGYNHPYALELYGSICFMKGALVYSDVLSTVSEGYARETMTPEHGGGLDGVLRARRRDYFGIRNGIDVDEWDPRSDTFIAARYSPEEMSGKALCKRALQQEFSLPTEPDVPLIGVVSRLVEQKGISLIEQVLPTLLQYNVQLVVLGSGEKRFERMFETYAARHPDRMAVHIGFDSPLAHRIEAGADIFLMPSLYEPCGLNQMYSIRYGTVPVVRAVGGLDDTVRDLDPASGEGNGFKFVHYDVNGLWWALSRALLLYRDKPVWESLRSRIMLEDFSWDRSARRYEALYHRALGR